MSIRENLTPSSIADDRTPHILPFLLPLLQSHMTSSPPRPFILGLNGPQGIGKTTLVSSLAEILRHAHNIETLVLSIDDFYLSREKQIALATEQRRNPLVQHRGEPGTHDILLLKEVFKALAEGREVRIPAYDKTAFAGRGDRVDVKEWRVVNGASQPRVQVVILEGWCVGFRALRDDDLRLMVEASWKTAEGTLGKHRLEDLVFVNEELNGYEEVWDMFDAFIYLDAEKLRWVYDWREEAEEVVRKTKGQGFGMTREQVRTFVDGYMPAYELYVKGLRRGSLSQKESAKGDYNANVKNMQMKLLIGRDRKVKQVTKYCLR